MMIPVVTLFGKKQNIFYGYIGYYTVYQNPTINTTTTCYST